MFLRVSIFISVLAEVCYHAKAIVSNTCPIYVRKQPKAAMLSYGQSTAIC